MMKKPLEIYKNLSAEVKTSLCFMICNVIQKCIAYITIPIFTRLLTDAAYGTYTLYLSWENIFLIFSTLNLGNQVFNNGMIKYANDRDGYTSSMVGLTFVTVSLFSIVYFVFRHGFDRAVDSIATFMPLMLLDMLFFGVVELWLVRKRYEYKYRSISILILIRFLLNPSLGLLLVLTCRSRIYGRILSIVISNAVPFAIVLWLVFKKSRRFAHRDYWKYALKLSLPLIPHHLSLVILNSSDLIMIANYCGESYTAYYSVANGAAIIMQIIFNSIRITLEPWIYQRLNEGNYAKIRKVTSPLILLVAALNLLPVLFAPECIAILGSSGYMQAVNIMPILSCSIFMLFLYPLFVSIELFHENNKLTAVGSVSAALLNILLNMIFIPRFGYEAAAYTTLVSYMLLTFFHYCMVKRICKTHHITERIFNARLIVLLTVSQLVVSVCVRFLYGSLLLRCGLILLLLIVLFVLRKKIIALLKNIRRRA